MADNKEIDLILKHLRSSNYRDVHSAALRIVDILEFLTWMKDDCGGFKICDPPEEPVEVKQLNEVGQPISKYSAQDLRIFKKALIDILLLHRKSRLDASCAWALGKFSGEDVKETLFRVLESNLNGDMHVLFQALIGLQNVGIKVFEISGSSDEYEVNRQIAARLLEERKDSSNNN